MYKNVLISVAMNDENLKSFNRLKGSAFLSNAKVHFVTVFEKQAMVSELTPYIYPSKEMEVEIKKVSTEKLRSLASDLGVPEENAVFSVIFDFDPQVKINEYAENNKNDLIAVATRKKEGFTGLFTSSFANFLNRHAPCDVVVMRPL